MRRNTLSLVVTTLVLGTAISVAGCRGRSLLPAAGPLLKQQSQAIINDPFPQNDIGPYEAASRPPGYQTPLPEPVRNRIHRDATMGFGR